MIKIAQITTSHYRYDTRIYHKICKSLSKAYDVTLYTADKIGNDESAIPPVISIINNNVKLRLYRWTIINFKLLRRCISNKYDVYHFHDPDFIPSAIILKFLGRRVIYDVHEDYPKNILQKVYIPEIIKKPTSIFIKVLEYFSSKLFDAIIAATPSIETRFLNYNKNTYLVCNYPIVNELYDENIQETRDGFCYVGAISEIRGIYELVDSLKYSKVKLYLAGPYSEESFMNKIKALEGWKYVEYFDHANRETVKKIFSKSLAGYVTLYPSPNHIDSLPTKMFEYMSAGLPVIASDIPFWKELIHKYDCGLNVNPFDSSAIAKATSFIKRDKNQYLRFSQNALRLVKDEVNWENEEIKLLELYQKLDLKKSNQ